MMLVAIFCVLAAATVKAVRLPPNVIAEVRSEAFPGGLKHVPSHLQALKAAALQREEDWTEKTAYATIKFTVPPSVSDKFEDAWLKLESEVVDKEEDWEIFDLKKTSLDNVFYLAYGEWDSVDALIHHLHSDHFANFAESADQLNVRWDLQYLEDLTEDLEEHQKGRKEHKRKHGTVAKKEEGEKAHILIYYIVPPAETDSFVDQWRNTAKKTLSEEKGNRVYSLASIADDNTQFYGYGTWNTMDDYLDHFESKHVKELREFLAKKNIIWFLAPLDKVGSQPE